MLRSFLIAAAALLLAAGGACSEAASGDPDDGFQSYPLRHAQASEVEAALAPLVPRDTEIVVDRRANRVLVGGPEEIQRVAQRVVQSLDQPGAAPSQPAPATPQGALRVIECRSGTAGPIAERLQAGFAKLPGVRIVADERTSKVLVLAPPELHDQIIAQAKALGASGENGAATAPRREAVASPSHQTAASTTRPMEVALRSISADRLETALISTLGKDLASLGGSGPDVGAYRLTLPQGAVELAIDRRANRVTVSGSPDMSQRTAQLIHFLDQPLEANDSTQFVPLRASRPADIQRAVQAIQMAGNAQPRLVAGAEPLEEQRVPLPGRLVQPAAKTAGDLGPVAQAEQPAAKPGQKPGTPGAQPDGEEGGGLVGPVQIEMIPGLDVIVIRGNKRDVKQAVDIIRRIEELTAVTEPVIEIYDLTHVDGIVLTNLLNQLYTQIYSARQSTVFLYPLVKPNALLIVGQQESVDRMIELAERFDVEVPPESQFEVFRLRHASAVNAQTVLQGVFGQDMGGLSPRVRVTVDTRANSLVVQAAPRDMAEVAALLARVDTPTSDAVNELRMFKLEHTLAIDMATVLQSAIQSQAGVARTGAPTQQPGQFPGAQPALPAQGAAAGQKSSMLQFLTIDAQGQQKLTSGILTDVQITPDGAANTLLVSAPKESMGLIEALVRQLDQPPAMRAEIKVFRIVNGDALLMTQMLEQLFLQQTTGGFPGGQAGALPRTAVREGESSLVPVRFAVDPRTNSIIAAGAAADLIVVEAIILRLDSADVRNRKSTIYRLKNVPATEVANSLSLFLRSESQLERTIAPQLMSPFEQIEREVVVVPETVTNSLIISATPRFYEDIIRLVEQLDERPPMVVIQVLIAEVELENHEEFGVELGLQDSLLFDRAQASAGTLATPGFRIGEPVFGPAAGFGNAAGQGLTDFAMGRGGGLGFGGLVLSASSESVSVLVRALKQQRRLEVLSRPQVTTLNNQEAYVQVGQQVPQIQGVTLTQYGQTNNVTYTDVGVILRVIPRISPDGLVVMLIDAIRSDVGAEIEGIPISVSATGQVIRAPRINSTLARTTVSAGSGQTVLLGGLINKAKTNVSRRVPYLSEVPVLGNLFRFDSDTSRRTELLIIMTPHVINSQDDMERIKKIEAARMHWCLTDVIAAHGDGGLRGRSDEWTDAETTVIYPDLKPGETMVPGPTLAPEAVPTPPATPLPLQPTPAPPPPPSAMAPGVEIRMQER